MRGIFFDINALVYGPTGSDFLSEVLRAEGISVEPVEVTEALSRLPAALVAMREAIRTEEQEDEYNRTLLPALVKLLGVADATDALLMRLIENVHEYHAYYSMYPETLPVLAELQTRGYVMAVVADWPPSLARFVREFGLDGYLAAVVADPFRFDRALKLTDLPAAAVTHVGPSLRQDVTEAAQAGIAPVWLNRTGIPTGHEVLTITDLRGLLMLAPKAGDEPWN